MQPVDQVTWHLSFHPSLTSSPLPTRPLVSCEGFLGTELDKAQIERLPAENIEAPDPHFMTDLEVIIACMCVFDVFMCACVEHVV